MRQLIYTMFVANNHASFHLWWKETLVKYQKDLKYYVNDCLQSFLFRIIFLLTASIVNNSHILAGVYFIFHKNVLEQTQKSFDTEFRPQWYSSYEVRQNLALFRSLLALILNWNCVKSFRVTKIIPKIKFERDLGEF